MKYSLLYDGLRYFLLLVGGVAKKLGDEDEDEVSDLMKELQQCL